MTPNGLLTDVLSRFSVLLANESQLHAALLKSSINTFQNRAGFRKQVPIQSHGEYALPTDFYSLEFVKDSYKCAVFETPYRKTGDANNYISFGSEESYPLTISYFVNLAKLDFANDELPQETIELIGDHLQILIEIENNKRIRRIEGMADEDVSNIPSETEKNAELQIIEERMTQEFGFVGMVSL